ncbi:MAG: A/G-specific adenine glycosylase [Chthoniobacterales bacterium]
MRRGLLAWFHKNGRDLPWRRPKFSSDYAVAVSEFMLQQTQVASVIPYFEKWITRWPDWHSLAAADEKEIFALWSGLGYYRRARNLHRLAQALVEKHLDELPREESELIKFPGIGDYTAAAIQTFAYDLPAPAVDANIARVLARIHNFRKPIDTTSGKKEIRRYAEALQFKSSGRLLNSALMDLGASLCRAGEPDCRSCPIARDCQADDPASIPVKRKKTQVTKQGDPRLLIVDADKKHLYLAHSKGPRWQGLWILPPLADFDKKYCSLVYRSNYSITRYRMDLQVYRVFSTPEILRDLKNSEYPVTRISIKNLPTLGVPSPFRKALTELL